MSDNVHPADDARSSNKLIAFSNFFPLDNFYKFWDKNIPSRVAFINDVWTIFVNVIFEKVHVTVLHICRISWAEMSAVRNVRRLDWRNSAIGVQAIFVDSENSRF